MLSLIVLCWLTCSHCTRLPKEKLYQFQTQITSEITEDTLQIQISNPEQRHLESAYKDEMKLLGNCWTLYRCW